MDTITQITTQDTAPDPAGNLGSKRLQKHVAPDRRISIKDADMRHGRKSSAKTFNGFKEPFVLALDRACRVMEMGGIRQRFQPKEHNALVLG